MGNRRSIIVRPSFILTSLLDDQSAKKAGPASRPSLGCNQQNKLSQSQGCAVSSSGDAFIPGGTAI